MKNKMNKFELLAPAGDLDRLKYALAYGADAVYLGLPEFSLRAKTGFDFASLKAGIGYARRLKKKVYVTVNIFAHQRQIEALPSFLRRLKACRPDALILADPGVLMLAKKILPDVPIHLSTQANTLNSEAVRFWRQNGVTRIILGRETTLDDIKRIHRLAPKMALEVFVHGAMCLSYSGRCYLSAEFSRRSANAGLCVQPCRWQYKLYAEEVTRPGRFLPLEEDASGLHIFNSKDLCLIEYLKDLAQAGVQSFKIEGRTKSQYYVASVVGAYRSVLDNQKNRRILASAIAELFKVDNRGYTTGFLVPVEPSSRQNLLTSKAPALWQVVGEVIGQKDRLAEIRVHNSLAEGDRVELLTPGAGIKIRVSGLRDAAGQAVNIAHGGTTKTFFIRLPAGVDAAWGLIRQELKKRPAGKPDAKVHLAVRRGRK